MRQQMKMSYIRITCVEHVTAAAAAAATCRHCTDFPKIARKNPNNNLLNICMMFIYIYSYARM